MPKKNTYVLPRPTSSRSNIILKNLLNQLEFTRNKTITYVENLPPTIFDTKIVEGMNSIGTILRHVAAMEFSNQVVTFEGRRLNAEEETHWHGSLTGQLKLDLIKGYSSDYYIDLLTNLRRKTEEVLLTKDDEWLFCNTLYQYDSPVNNYFCWFHVMEDELSHMGQIKMLVYYYKNL